MSLTAHPTSSAVALPPGGPCLCQGEGLHWLHLEALPRGSSRRAPPLSSWPCAESHCRSYKYWDLHQQVQQTSKAYNPLWQSCWGGATVPKSDVGGGVWRGGWPRMRVWQMNVEAGDGRPHLTPLRLVAGTLQASRSTGLFGVRGLLNKGGQQNHHRCCRERFKMAEDQEGQIIPGRVVWAMGSDVKRPETSDHPRLHYWWRLKLHQEMCVKTINNPHSSPLSQLVLDRSRRGGTWFVSS